MYPKREMSKSVQAVCPLVVVQEAAAVAPATSFVLRRLGRLPFPRPVELNGRVASGRVVPNKLDVRIILQIRVGVELPRDQIIQFFRIRGMCEGESREDRIDQLWKCRRDAIYRRARCATAALRLSQYKRKLEIQFVFVIQA